MSSEIPMSDPEIINKICDHRSKDLPHIDLSYNGRRRIIKRLTNLPEGVGILDLHNSWIRDNDLIYLAGRDIEHLCLNRCASITNKGLQNLSSCRNIKELTIGGNSISDEGLKYLSNIPKLTFIDVSNITDKGLKYLCLNENIVFKDCPKITDKGMNYLTNVRFIEILNCDDNIAYNGLRNLNLKASEISHPNKHLLHKSVHNAAIISHNYEINKHDIKKLSNVKNIYIDKCYIEINHVLKYLTHTENIFFIRCILRNFNTIDFQSMPNIKNVIIVERLPAFFLELKENLAKADIKVYEWKEGNIIEKNTR